MVLIRNGVASKGCRSLQTTYLALYEGHLWYDAVVTDLIFFVVSHVRQIPLGPVKHQGCGGLVEFKSTLHDPAP